MATPHPPPFGGTFPQRGRLISLKITAMETVMLDFRKNKYKLIAAGLALVLIAIGVFAAVRAVRAKRNAA